MTDEPQPPAGPAADDPHTAAERRARRRRLAEVFGEVLPEQTSDDADDPQSGEQGTDEWLRRQVPPHHGG